jgi:hypothetical protein
MELKKQNISLRMNTSDLRKVKQIAQRLGARESDVFRFAIKSTLAKLSPLYELQAHGSDLVPVFMEVGPELAKYFDLDSTRLDRIINSGVEDPLKRVDRDDLELLALSRLESNYMALKLRERGARPAAQTDGPATLLREYLLQKYLSRVVVPEREAV